MSNFLFNGKQRIVDLNGSAGAYVALLATILLRRVVVQESLLTSTGAANTPQGLTYTLPGSTQTFQLPVPTTTQEPGEFPKIEIPDREDMSFHQAYGNVIGNGPDTPGAGVAPTLATTLMTLRSATATATSVLVTEIA